MTPLELIECARNAQNHAYAPYSGFRVGAALLTTDGRVFQGCNIENEAFSPTVCAERTAFFNAVSTGACSFEAIAIVGAYSDGSYKRLCAPCGVCRQVMSEFCTPDFKVILGNDTADFEVMTLRELLPAAFTLEES